MGKLLCVLAEREALQQQGDELDAQIQKGEKEIKALENTLLMLQVVFGGLEGRG
jgi:hypothetical protein